MERQLAAHSYAMTDQTEASSKSADASATYHGQTGMGLEATKYGQMAMSMDYSGCLRSINSGKFAIFEWVGKAPSEQTDYVDRD